MDLNTSSLKEKIENRLADLDLRKAELERKIADIGRQKQELRGSLEAVKTVERHALALDSMAESGEFRIETESEAEDEEAPEGEILTSAADETPSVGDTQEPAVVTTLKSTAKVFAADDEGAEDDEDLMMVQNLFAASDDEDEEAASANGNGHSLENVLKEVDPAGSSDGLDAQEPKADDGWPKASSPESIVPKFLKKYL